MANYQIPSIWSLIIGICYLFVFCFLVISNWLFQLFNLRFFEHQRLYSRITSGNLHYILIYFS
jgi:hypothetical protein